MTPRWSPYVAACVGAVLAIGFVAVFRMPVLFPGSSVAFAAVLAGSVTLSLIAWMPARWLWTDSQRLAFAFKAHHGLSDLGASNALTAITEAHGRADNLRSASVAFHEDLKPKVTLAADRLDASAREIFYEPDRLGALRAILIRSELIEDATRAHRALRARSRNDEATVATSRETLMRALAALQDAFEASDLRAAKGHLEQVKIASDVAETLLSPRRPF